MSEQSTFFTRIGQWFKGHRQDGMSVPVEKSADAPSVERVETRPMSIFRPWARRDAAIASLQQAFHSLTDLMGTIRDNLEKQNQRQDEILSHLSHLPEILQSLPEATRVHGETLKTIGEQLEQQLEHQISQQGRLTDILAKVSEANADQKELLQSLHERVETVDQHNEAIADNLRQVGSAMADMGRNTESSAKVLEQVRECIDNRDNQMQRVIEQQNKRFTTLIIVAIVLAAVAVVAVSVVGFLLLNRP